MTDTTLDARAARRDTAFLGHPAGLGWLAAAEFWERFSYYGMTTLLVLYMTHSLLQPGHVEHIWGFVPFRHLIESVTGKLSPQALASQVYGLYAGLVYLTPIAGGLLADQVTGRTRAVALGAGLMALGHFLMAFDASFLLALLCLLLGVGCFKGNIASQVGDLYRQDDPRRADAFQIYLFAVQLAVIFAPLVCGRLAVWYDWHWGFGAAGVGMLIGLVIYLAGRPTLPEEERTRRTAGAAPKPVHTVTRREWAALAVLVALLPVLAVGQVGNGEIFNAYLVWGEANYQLGFFGMTMPITDLLAYGSIISAGTIASSAYFWRWWGRHWREPEEISKMTIGVAIGAAAPLLLVAASALIAASRQKAGLGWAVAFEIVNDFGFANVFPVGLALYSRAAPRHLVGAVIGLYYLHLFFGNLLVGWLGGLLEKMPATSFWLLHVGLMLAAGAILLLVRLVFGRLLAPAYAAPETA
ncbi:MAG: oligopeptide:H+ symporter [Rhizomicrobium sp.]